MGTCSPQTQTIKLIMTWGTGEADLHRP